MSIEHRVSKLEQHSHRAPPVRPMGVSEEAMAEIRRVAAVVSSSEELARFVATLDTSGVEEIVSLDDHRRRDAAISAFARSVFDEVRGR